MAPPCFSPTLPLAALACGVLGCASPPLLTSQLQVNVDATADGNQHTAIEAFMWDSFGANAYDLRDDESLIAVFHGQRQSMTVDTSTTDGHYVATFAVDPDPGESFTVDFERGSAPSAPDTTGRFPPTSVLSGPTVASRSQPLTVTWSPSGFTDLVELYPGIDDCGQLFATDPLSLGSGDPGSATLSPVSAGSVTCSTTLTFERELDNAGAPDPHLDVADSLSTTTTVSSTLMFTSTP